MCSYFFFQAEDGIRDIGVTGVQTCALPIWPDGAGGRRPRPRDGAAAAAGPRSAGGAPCGGTRGRGGRRRRPAQRVAAPGRGGRRRRPAGPDRALGVLSRVSPRLPGTAGYMQIDKNQILELLRNQGDDAKAQQADQELPGTVDTDEHAGILEKLGLSPMDLISKLGGGGGRSE